jgi:hypothetical protein
LVEEFEKRVLLSLTVNSSGDDSDGGTPMDPYGPDGTLSLREAINLVNQGYDSSISFAVSTVTPLSSLPTITSPVTINGSGVTIDGSSSGGGNGLDFYAGSNMVTGLTINGFDGAELLFEAGNNTIQGNFVGTNMGGTEAVGGLGDGIDLNGDGDMIGGNGQCPPSRNPCHFSRLIL